MLLAASGSNGDRVRWTQSVYGRAEREWGNVAGGWPGVGSRALGANTSALRKHHLHHKRPHLLPLSGKSKSKMVTMALVVAMSFEMAL